MDKKMYMYVSHLTGRIDCIHAPRTNDDLVCSLCNLMDAFIGVYTTDEEEKALRRIAEKMIDMGEI